MNYSGDPVINYLQNGYFRGLNPTKDFDTRFYRATNPDIDKAGMNGFVHYIRYGRKERRSPQSYFSNTDDFNPLISIIIPNYNHAAYLEERLRSVAKQTYTNIEIMILDDCSTDNSREVIKEIIKEYDDVDIKLLFNTENSGGVFNQWQKGINAAAGDYVWICESDDFCDYDFLKHIVPHFADRSVNISFGKIEFCDKQGKLMPGMDGYRETSESGIWKDSIKRPAKEWFNNGFGVNNVIANVGGCVFRKAQLSPDVWTEAKSFKICGDWYLYLHIAGGGQVAYEPRSLAYFRQHDKNTSATNFDKLYFYQELNRISQEIEDYWQTPTETKERFLTNVEFGFKHWKMPENGHDFDEIFRSETPPSSRKPHILVGFLGFVSGGGEVFAINLANALHERGYVVSMIAVEMHHFNTEMYDRLRAGIAVYSIANLAEMGRETFFKSAGIDLVHSNIVGVESLLFEMDKEKKVEVPYVVSLHGSYDGFDIKRLEILNLLNLCHENVTYWVNTAEKNLAVLNNAGLELTHLSRVDNAMPADPRPYPKTREELGIPEDAFVYAFVARGVEGKGWPETIKAFQTLQKKVGGDKIHLIMVGNGDIAEKAVKKIQDKDNITYLGYQSEINGVYRLSDCALVPTRFVGESFPLCIIQALQETLPVIATDHGEIKKILTLGKKRAGHLIKYDENNTPFIQSLTSAMEDLYAKQGYRDTLIKNIPEIRDRFEMPQMIKKYEAIYQSAQKIYHDNETREN